MTSPVVQASPPRPKSQRIAAIDWVRGFVMLLMIVDHASMAFDRDHISQDSAMYAEAATMALPAGEFFTRWMTHVCAPTFVFLAGTALALSIERRVARGENAWEIDKNILIRGAIIVFLDMTVISLGVGRFQLSVLYAIGVSMMAMAALRRLPTWGLMAFGLGWFVVSEWLTAQVWSPPGPAPIWVAMTVATSGGEAMSVKYPVIPWLAMMTLGWGFGRHINDHAAGKTRITPARVMLLSAVIGLAVFVVARGFNSYGNMFLPRAGDDWQQWLHVSKYPPSLTYAALELGLMAFFLWLMMRLEPIIGVRENGPLLVFGQTAMFYYLVHRFVFDVLSVHFGLHGVGTIGTTYAVAIGMAAVLFPACLWYRRFKQENPTSLLRYL